MNGAKKMSFISLCEVGASVGNSRRPYFWRYINRGCSICVSDVVRIGVGLGL